MSKMTGSAAGVCLLASVLAFAGARPAQETPRPPCNPQEWTLGANLYMQASAEYEALCLQIYGWAAERLRSRLAAPRSELPPAVIMDLDETVIDNGAYQAFLDREGLQHTEQLWSVWERDFPQEVRLVPGASGFIASAEQAGVTVFYISNRYAENRAGTVEALRRLGLNVQDIDRRLLLKDRASDKSPRRRIVQERHDVVMLIGDNLRDFSEEFAAPSPPPEDSRRRMQAIEERARKVRRSAYKFGSEWIVLPNPAYGEWTVLLGKDLRSNLRSTRMRPPASR